MDRFFTSLPKPRDPSFSLSETPIATTANNNNNNHDRRETPDPASTTTPDGIIPEKKKLPKGVVLGKDGKPCRSCTSFASWAALTKSAPAPTSSSTPSTSTSATATSSITPQQQQPLPLSLEEAQERCPPDVALLGRSTWTLLHSISATYPETASAGEQRDMRTFLALMGKLYPCWPCAADFQEWMADRKHVPRVEGREALGRWMCEAHNEVNRKLGKGEFDCGKWEERWRTGGEGCG